MRRYLQSIAILFLLLIATTVAASAHDGPHVTVQPGDTLSEIAKQNNTNVAALRRLNNLSNTDVIRTGGLLALPNVGQPDGSITIEVSPRQISGKLYTVEPGDTLSEIAQQNGINLALLVEINQISPAQRLYAGQELRLPTGPLGIVADRPTEHVVQPGEQLGTIAVQYGLSAADIARANRLTAPNLIAPGQTLVIGDVDPTLSPLPLDDEPSTQLDNSEQEAAAVESPPTNEKWIDVDLGSQTVVAYEAGTPVNSFIISSGLPGTPTVTGEFRIWAKTSIQDMYGGNRAAGTYYYLEDVQWVQYFFEDYAFHGTYWHNNFGQPMSRGCINMQNEDAKWLFEWARPQTVQAGWLISDAANRGTLVIVHE